MSILYIFRTLKKTLLVLAVVVSFMLLVTNPSERDIKSEFSYKMEQIIQYQFSIAQLGYKKEMPAIKKGIQVLTAYLDIDNFIFFKTISTNQIIALNSSYVVAYPDDRNRDI